MRDEPAGARPQEDAEEEGDLYSALGVQIAAPLEEIRRAWRAAALRYHPDRQGAGDPRASPRYARIQEAWETLREPATREAYDRSLAARSRLCAEEYLVRFHDLALTASGLGLPLRGAAPAAPPMAPLMPSPRAC